MYSDKQRDVHREADTDGTDILIQAIVCVHSG